MQMFVVDFKVTNGNKVSRNMKLIRIAGSLIEVSENAHKMYTKFETNWQLPLQLLTLQNLSTTIFRIF